MDQPLAVTTSLLLRLRQSDDLVRSSAWAELVENYTPYLRSLGFLRELQAADAADVIQETLTNAFCHIAQFNRSRGVFAQWLYGICRNTAAQFVNRRKAAAGLQGRGGDDSDARLANLATSTDNDPWLTALCESALEATRPKVSDSDWQAFEQTQLIGLSSAEAAERLEKSENAVNVARFKVKQQFKTEFLRLRDAL